jgi:hypothetical protein
MEVLKVEELLKQILEQNKTIASNVEKMAGDITRLNEGQKRFEKVQETMAKDIKAIRDYQHKGLDVDVEKLKYRVNVLEENQKIS